MAADIVNLRLARKRKARAEAEDTAAANRARHGITGAERSRVKLERRQAEAHLDGAKRESPADDGDRD